MSKKFVDFQLQEVKDYHSLDQLQEFMLKHGENIVDMMGDEIDRIEMNLSVSKISKHCRHTTHDLILNISFHVT